MTRNVALCGLGNMGGAIAVRLADLGALTVFDLDPARASQATVDVRVSAVATVADLAGSDVVVLSLPNPAVSLAVINQVVPRMAPGGVVIETSTVNPSDMAIELKACAAHDISLVGAAVLSGVTQMREGRSTLLVGGEEADIALVRGILEAMTPDIVEFGAIGAGMAAKVINNAVAHAVMVVLAEAGALAVTNGISGREIAALLARPDAGLMRPLTHRFTERVLGGDYDGGMPTDAARKDSALALAMAQQSHVPLFVIQAAHTIYELAGAADLDRADYAAVATLWEKWTGRPMTETSVRSGVDAQ